MHDVAELRCRAGSDCTVERNFAADPASIAVLEMAGLRRGLSFLADYKLLVRRPPERDRLMVVL